MTQSVNKNNGVFFFREEQEGTKKQFIELAESLHIPYNLAGNIAIRNFIRKYKPKKYGNKQTND